MGTGIKETVESVVASTVEKAGKVIGTEIKETVEAVTGKVKDLLNGLVTALKVEELTYVLFKI